MSYNSTSSWIKLDRRILKWGWYSDINVKVTFLHLLLIASYEGGEFLGEEIKRGQAVIGINKTSKEIGITPRQFRTALSKLEKNGEITKKATSKFTVITVENYSKYQDVPTESDKQMTSERQTDDKQMTSERQTSDNIQESKESKESKKVKNNIYIRPHAGEFENVKLTKEELDKLQISYSDCYEEYIEKLSSYLAQTGKRYKSHYATLLNWIRRDGKEKQETKQDNAVKVTVV
mgnify:FL=1